MNRLIFELPCKHSVTLEEGNDDVQAFLAGWNITIKCSSCNLRFEFNHNDGYLKSFKPEGMIHESDSPRACISIEQLGRRPGTDPDIRGEGATE